MAAKARRHLESCKPWNRFEILASIIATRLEPEDQDIRPEANPSLIHCYPTTLLLHHFIMAQLTRLGWTVCLLFALILGVASSPLLQERNSLKCRIDDMQIVKRTAIDPVYFCKWWNAESVYALWQAGGTLLIIEQYSHKIALP